MLTKGGQNFNEYKLLNNINVKGEVMLKEKKFYLKSRRILCLLLIIIMIVCCITPNINIITYAQSEITNLSSVCETNVVISNSWEGGYQAEITITNISERDIIDWYVTFNCEDTIVDMWNATLVSTENNVYEINNADWNSCISGNANVTFGFIANYDIETNYFEDIQVYGIIKSTNEQTDIEAVSSGDIYLYEDTNYTIKYIIENVWDGNYNVKVEIINKGVAPIENWLISFLCDNEISNIYNANIVKHENNIYQIKNAEYNQDIPVGGLVSFGFQVSYTDKVDIPHPYIIFSEESIISADEYQIEFVVKEAWEDGYIGEIILTNVSNRVIEDWRLLFESNDNIINIWNGRLEDSDKEYGTIYGPDEHQNLDIGECHVIGFQASGVSQEYVFHGLYEMNSQGTDTSDDIQINCDIMVNTDNFRQAEFEDTYYVETDIYSLSGELLDYNYVEKLDYSLTDINGRVLLEDNIFDKGTERIPSSSWEIDNFGLAIGCNQLNFEMQLYDGTLIKKTIVLIDLTGNNMDRVAVDLTDSDQDGLNNYFESLIKTDCLLSDTDGDGLSDFEEFVQIGTSPLLTDTDGNGITDDKEDYDNDGLDSKTELQYFTNIALEDSDYDGINDGEEVNKYQSNPLLADTDGDGLYDGEEKELGYNLLLLDSDGDSITDIDEKTVQTRYLAVENDNKCVRQIGVTLDCPGHINNQVYIEELSGRNCMSSEVVGLVGVPINISTDVEFEEATISFEYDPTQLGETLEENLGILWYDEENAKYVIMDNVTVDTNNHIVTCITTHFSEYMLVDIEEWNSVWLQAKEYVPTPEPCDIAIMSDSTAGSSYHWTKGLGLVNYDNGFIDGENITYGYFNANRTKIIRGWASNLSEFQKVKSDALYFHLYSVGYRDKGDRNGKYGDGFEKLVDIFSNEKYMELNSDNPKIAIFTYDGYLSETEEQNQKVIDSLQKLEELEVTLYVISETSHSSSFIVQAVTEYGGVHYNLNSKVEADNIWDIIRKDIMRSNEVDSDGDGLLDNYELCGMRIPNGKVITTDPNNPDTDGDGRSDGEEMGEKIICTVEVDSADIKQTFEIFKMLSNPNTKDTLSGSFIYVDSLDYMPYSNTLNNMINKDEVKIKLKWTNDYPIDRNGQPIYGLANLHNSLDFSLPGETPVSSYDNIETIYRVYNEWLTRIFLLKGSSLCGKGYVPLELLEHYINNSGLNYNYKANVIWGKDLNYNLLINLYYLKQECINVMRKDDVVYIATSPDANFYALNVLGADNQLANAILNLNSLLAVNSGHATMVAECHYDGEQYTLYYRYYILDYYDWHPNVMQDLYSLNVYGLSNSFLSTGRIEGQATFTADSEIDNLIFPAIAYD